MFTFPPSKWVGGIFYEHGHRLIASTRRVPHDHPRRRGSGWRAAPLDASGSASSRSAPSSLQGVLGGLTVLFFLPAPISTAHAGLAEIFFCLTVAIALFTSPGWIARRRGAVDDADAPAAGHGDDGADLRADSRRRDDAAHRTPAWRFRTSR